MERVLPGVYRFRDICNVYLLQVDHFGLLMDAGSGAVRPHLRDVGVDRIEWVLHTHFHRDQSAGDHLLQAAGAKIAASKREADQLRPANATAPYAASSRSSLPGRNAPFWKPGVDRELVEGDVVEWRGLRLRVLETPGHTESSLTYLLETGGRRALFSGDLVLSGGHARDLYSMQWEYLENPGLDASLASLAKLESARPQLLLPSHGEPIGAPHEDIPALRRRLERTAAALRPDRRGRWNWSGLVQISPHVIQDCGTTTQVILADDGAALLFDCGEHEPEKLAQLRTKFGLSKVEVVIPSHWHGDHIGGISDLARATGAQVWAWEGLAEHLEHPERFITTWRQAPIKIDRVLREGEEFTWGGYAFKVYHHPIHMEQQMALWGRIDDLTFYFLADGLSDTRNEPLRGSIHCYNGITLASGLLKTARSFSDADPYVCVPAHANCFATDDDTRAKFLGWAEEAAGAIADLLPPAHPDLGYDPYWATFYPATVKAAAPGQTITVAVRITNHARRPVQGIIRPRVYGDLSVKAEVVSYGLKPGETRDFSFQVQVEPQAAAGLHVLTADVEYDGELFGEWPQGYVEVAR